MSLTAVIIINEAQTLAWYDTLQTRSNVQILVPRYDTIEQLRQANAKADSLLMELAVIKCRLGIKDTVK